VVATSTLRKSIGGIAQDWLATGIRIWALFVLTLHIAAYQLPEAVGWSVWPYTFLPLWLGWTLALLAGLLIIPAVNNVVYTGLHWFGQGLVQIVQPIHASQKVWFALIALLSGIFFWLARLQHLRWGDSYLLSVALSYPDLDLRVVYNWQAPLTVFLHQRLWQFVVNPWLGWPVKSVYAVISVICGILFVYVLLNFAVRLGRTRAEIVVIAGMVLTTGSMQLFFGYVENYTVVALLLLATLFLGWRTAYGELSLAWPVVGLSVTNAFHPSTVFLWPGMLLLGYLSWRHQRVSLLSGVLQTVLPPIIVAGLVLALMEGGGHGVAAFLGKDRPGGGDGIWFVPLFQTTTEWQRYTMFSAEHFLDWANIHLLISPFGLPVLLMSLLTIYRFRLSLFQDQADRDFSLFLGLTAFMYVLLTWVWNPDYGGQKDWDLFAPSAFVYTLLAGYVMGRIFADRPALRTNGLLIIVVSLLHTSAWIFANTHNLPRS
jgi:hypothetical protein